MSEPPEIAEVPGIAVRHFHAPRDIDLWLEIRHRAFARERLGVRRWDRADFEKEFLSKHWWRPDRMWIAETTGRLVRRREAVGTVTLALRGEGEQPKPVVHWLAVLPRWRRRGIARLLMTTLEAACWEVGYRQIWLETHTAWSAAAQFYAKHGYEPAAC